MEVVLGDPGLFLGDKSYFDLYEDNNFCALGEVWDF